MANWDETNPADSGIVSAFPGNERSARGAVKTNFGVDHHETDDANVGRHDWASFIEQASDPSALANIGFLYAKDVSGVTEIYYRDSAGNILQITQAGALTSDKLRSLSTTAATLAATAHGLQIGLTSGANLAGDTAGLQARNNGAGANLLLNQYGGDVRQYSGAALKTTTSALGFGIYSDTNMTVATDNPGNGQLRIIDSDGSILAAQFGFLGSTLLLVHNRVEGGSVEVRIEDSAGNVETVFEGVPDSYAGLGFGGASRLRTTAAGASVRAAGANDPTAGGTQDQQLTLVNTAGALASLLGFNAATMLRLENRVHGGSMVLSVEDSSGNVEAGVQIDPDAATRLGFGGVEKLLTAAAGAKVLSDAAMVAQTSNPGTGRLTIRDSDDTNDAGLFGFLNSTTLRARNAVEGGALLLEVTDTSSTVETVLQAVADGALSLYFGGTEALKTASRTATDKGTGAEVLDGGGVMRPVGMNVTPITDVSANTDLRLANVGHQLRITGAAAIDIDTTTDDTPDGQVWVIVNESGAARSITATGVTLKHLNGTGGATGNRTLADGSYCTVTKRADGQYQIVGNGLS